MMSMGSILQGVTILAVKVKPNLGKELWEEHQTLTMEGS